MVRRHRWLRTEDWARRGTEASLGRFRGNAWLIVQTAGTAALAWLLPTTVLGHHDPSFAPIGAVIAVEVTRGQRLRHAIELSVGVLFGLAVATLLGLLIANPALRIAVVVAVTMTVALLISASEVFVVQASVAAIFLAATPIPDITAAGGHLLDALIGCAVAIIVTQLVLPLHPVRLVNRAARPVFDQLADALDEVASALDTGDRSAAEHALAKARAIDEPVRQLREVISSAQQIARVAPVWRHTRGRLEPYRSAAPKVDYAVRNTRVLARAAIELLTTGRPAPLALVVSARELAQAVRVLGAQLIADEPRAGARETALRAAAQATEALNDNDELAVAMVVGQIRSTALDLLRGTGMDVTTAEQALDEVAGPTTKKS